jgi:hypothetical protein
LRENIAIRDEIKDMLGSFKGGLDKEDMDGIRRDTGGNDQEPEGELGP